MQGINRFIPTEKKVAYINQLLDVGFDTIDFGSFVSKKAIPQLQDTAEVLAKLDFDNRTSKLLAIIANTRGALEALKHPEIDYLGFPMSISETFQQRNTNKSISESLSQLAEIQDACVQHAKTLVVYISMGFGNPYGDPYEKEIVLKFSDILRSLDISIISVADTIGIASPERVGDMFGSLSSQFPKIEMGIHLHATPDQVEKKVEAAIKSGCRRIDGAILGYGGCPMAEDDLVGNIDTRVIKNICEKYSIDHQLNNASFTKAEQLALETFS